MKLWIDAQLSPSLAKWITENFDRIEAIAIRDLGLRDAEDQVIFFSARSAEATVMTKDGDFLELQKRLGAPPKIIWVTCGNTSKARLKTILTEHLQKAFELFEGGTGFGGNGANIKWNEFGNTIGHGVAALGSGLTAVGLLAAPEPTGLLKSSVLPHLLDLDMKYRKNGTLQITLTDRLMLQAVFIWIKDHPNLYREQS